MDIQYEQHVLSVEHVSFVPVVLSSTNGMFKCVSALNKRIASMQSAKTNKLYNKIIANIRCHISFSLLRSSVMCLLHGAKRFSTHATHLHVLQWRLQ